VSSPAFAFLLAVTASAAVMLADGCNLKYKDKRVIRHHQQREGEDYDAGPSRRLRKAMGNPLNRLRGALRNRGRNVVKVKTMKKRKVGAKGASTLKVGKNKTPRAKVKVKVKRQAKKVPTTKTPKKAKPAGQGQATRQFAKEAKVDGGQTLLPKMPKVATPKSRKPLKRRFMIPKGQAAASATGEAVYPTSAVANPFAPVGQQQFRMGAAGQNVDVDTGKGENGGKVCTCVDQHDVLSPERPKRPLFVNEADLQGPFAGSAPMAASAGEVAPGQHLTVTASANVEPSLDDAIAATATAMAEAIATAGGNEVGQANTSPPTGWSTTAVIVNQEKDGEVAEPEPQMTTPHAGEGATGPIGALQTDSGIFTQFPEPESQVQAEVEASVAAKGGASTISPSNGAVTAPTAIPGLAEAPVPLGLPHALPGMNSMGGMKASEQIAPHLPGQFGHFSPAAKASNLARKLTSKQKATAKSVAKTAVKALPSNFGAGHVLPKASAHPQNLVFSGTAFNYGGGSINFKGVGGGAQSLGNLALPGMGGAGGTPLSLAAGSAPAAAQLGPALGANAAIPAKSPALAMAQPAGKTISEAETLAEVEDSLMEYSSGSGAGLAVVVSLA